MPICVLLRWIVHWRLPRRRPGVVEPLIGTDTSVY
jgi:hypothetical protein